MKLISWNILHGGGNRLEAICSAVCTHDPEVIVFGEARTSTVRHIESSLWLQRWPYRASTEPSGSNNGICILSRTPLRLRDGFPAPTENAVRWLDVDVPDCGFGIGALHIPTGLGADDQNGASKRRFWSAVVREAEARTSEPFVFVGDLNTGVRGVDEAGRTFVCSAEFEHMLRLGWTDVWRHFNGAAFEPTWVSNLKNGYRLDHAFVSPPLLPRVLSCRYSHDERLAGISDHSILCLEIRD
jgi:exonuclease III